MQPDAKDADITNKQMQADSTIVGLPTLKYAGK